MLYEKTMESYLHWQTIAKEELRQDTADLLAMHCIMAYDSARLKAAKYEIQKP